MSGFTYGYSGAAPTEEEEQDEKRSHDEIIAAIAADATPTYTPPQTSVGYGVDPNQGDAFVSPPPPAPTPEPAAPEPVAPPPVATTADLGYGFEEFNTGGEIPQPWKPKITYISDVDYFSEMYPDLVMMLDDDFWSHGIFTNPEQQMEWWNQEYRAAQERGDAQKIAELETELSNWMYWYDNIDTFRDYWMKHEPGMQNPTMAAPAFKLESGEIVEGASAPYRDVQVEDVQSDGQMLSTHREWRPDIQQFMDDAARYRQKQREEIERNQAFYKVHGRLPEQMHEFFAFQDEVIAGAMLRMRDDIMALANEQKSPRALKAMAEQNWETWNKEVLGPWLEEYFIQNARPALILTGQMAAVQNNEDGSPSAWKQLVSGAAALVNPSMGNIAIVEGTPIARTQEFLGKVGGLFDWQADVTNWTADIIQSGWEWSQGQFSNNPYMNWAVDILPFNHVYNFGVNVGLKYGGDVLSGLKSASDYLYISSAASTVAGGLGWAWDQANWVWENMGEQAYLLNNRLGTLDTVRFNPVVAALIAASKTTKDWFLTGNWDSDQFVQEMYDQLATGLQAVGKMITLGYYQHGHGFVNWGDVNNAQWGIAASKTAEESTAVALQEEWKAEYQELGMLQKMFWESVADPLNALGGLGNITRGIRFARLTNKAHKTFLLRNPHIAKEFDAWVATMPSIMEQRRVTKLMTRVFDGPQFQKHRDSYLRMFNNDPRAIEIWNDFNMSVFWRTYGLLEEGRIPAHRREVYEKIFSEETQRATRRLQDLWGSQIDPRNPKQNPFHPANQKQAAEDVAEALAKLSDEIAEETRALTEVPEVRSLVSTVDNQAETTKQAVMVLEPEQQKVARELTLNEFVPERFRRPEPDTTLPATRPEDPPLQTQPRRRKTTKIGLRKPYTPPPPQPIGPVIQGTIMPDMPQVDFIKQIDFTTRPSPDPTPINAGQKRWVEMVEQFYGIPEGTLVNLFGGPMGEREMNWLIRQFDLEAPRVTDTSSLSIIQKFKRSPGEVGNLPAHAELESIYRTAQEANQAYNAGISRIWYDRNALEVFAREMSMSVGQAKQSIADVLGISKLPDKHDYSLGYWGGKNWQTTPPTEAQIDKLLVLSLMNGKDYFADLNTLIEARQVSQFYVSQLINSAIAEVPAPNDLLELSRLLKDVPHVEDGFALNWKLLDDQIAMALDHPNVFFRDEAAPFMSELYLLTQDKALWEKVAKDHPLRETFGWLLDAQKNYAELLPHAVSIVQTRRLVDNFLPVLARRGKSKALTVTYTATVGSGAARVRRMSWGEFVSILTGPAAHLQVDPVIGPILKELSQIRVAPDGTIPDHAQALLNHLKDQETLALTSPAVTAEFRKIIISSYYKDDIAKSRQVMAEMAPDVPAPAQTPQAARGAAEEPAPVLRSKQERTKALSDERYATRRQLDSVRRKSMHLEHKLKPVLFLLEDERLWRNGELIQNSPLLKNSDLLKAVNNWRRQHKWAGLKSVESTLQHMMEARRQLVEYRRTISELTKKLEEMPQGPLAARAEKSQEAFAETKLATVMDAAEETGMFTTIPAATDPSGMMPKIDPSAARTPEEYEAARVEALRRVRETSTADVVGQVQAHSTLPIGEENPSFIEKPSNVGRTAEESEMISNAFDRLLPEPPWKGAEGVRPAHKMWTTPEELDAFNTSRQISRNRFFYALSPFKKDPASADVGFIGEANRQIWQYRGEKFGELIRALSAPTSPVIKSADDLFERAVKFFEAAGVSADGYSVEDLARQFVSRVEDMSGELGSTYNWAVRVIADPHLITDYMDSLADEVLQAAHRYLADPNLTPAQRESMQRIANKQIGNREQVRRWDEVFTPDEKRSREAYLSAMRARIPKTTRGVIERFKKQQRRGTWGEAVTEARKLGTRNTIDNVDDWYVVHGEAATLYMNNAEEHGFVKALNMAKFEKDEAQIKAAGDLFNIMERKIAEMENIREQYGQYALFKKLGARDKKEGAELRGLQQSGKLDYLEEWEFAALDEIDDMLEALEAITPPGLDGSSGFDRIAEERRLIGARLRGEESELDLLDAIRQWKAVRQEESLLIQRDSLGAHQMLERMGIDLEWKGLPGQQRRMQNLQLQLAEALNDPNAEPGYIAALVARVREVEMSSQLSMLKGEFGSVAANQKATVEDYLEVLRESWRDPVSGITYYDLKRSVVEARENLKKPQQTDAMASDAAQIPFRVEPMLSPVEPPVLQPREWVFQSPDDVAYIRNSRDELGPLHPMYGQQQIPHEGIMYQSSEALFQAMQFRNPELRRVIASQGNGYQAMRKAEELKKTHPHEVLPESTNREWLINAMYESLYLKAAHSKSFRDALISTGDKQIVSGGVGGFWHVGKDDGVGMNVLGQLLMQIRKQVNDADELAAMRKKADNIRHEIAQSNLSPSERYRLAVERLNGLERRLLEQAQLKKAYFDGTNLRPLMESPLDESLASGRTATRSSKASPTSGRLDELSDPMEFVSSHVPGGLGGIPEISTIGDDVRPVIDELGLESKAEHLPGTRELTDEEIADLATEKMRARQRLQERRQQAAGKAEQDAIHWQNVRAARDSMSDGLKQAERDLWKSRQYLEDAVGRVDPETLAEYEKAYMQQLHVFGEMLQAERNHPDTGKLLREFYQPEPRDLLEQPYYFRKPTKGDLESSVFKKPANIEAAEMEVKRAYYDWYVSKVRQRPAKEQNALLDRLDGANEKLNSLVAEWDQVNPGARDHYHYGSIIPFGPQIAQGIVWAGRKVTKYAKSRRVVPQFNPAPTNVYHTVFTDPALRKAWGEYLDSFYKVDPRDVRIFTDFGGGVDGSMLSKGSQTTRLADIVGMGMHHYMAVLLRETPTGHYDRFDFYDDVKAVITALAKGHDVAKLSDGTTIRPFQMFQEYYQNDKHGRMFIQGLRVHGEELLKSWDQMTPWKTLGMYLQVAPSGGDSLATKVPQLGTRQIAGQNGAVTIQKFYSAEAMQKWDDFFNSSDPALRYFGYTKEELEAQGGWLKRHMDLMRSDLAPEWQTHVRPAFLDPNTGWKEADYRDVADLMFQRLRDEPVDTGQLMQSITDRIFDLEAKRLGYDPSKIPPMLKVMQAIKRNFAWAWMTIVPRYHVNNVFGNVMAALMLAARGDNHYALFRNTDRVRRLIDNPHEITIMDPWALMGVTRAQENIMGTAQIVRGDKFELPEVLRIPGLKQTFGKWAEGGAWLGDTIERSFKTRVYMNELLGSYEANWGMRMNQILSRPGSAISPEAGQDLLGVMGLTELNAVLHRHGITGRDAAELRSIQRSILARAQNDAYMTTMKGLRDYRMRSELDLLLDRLIPVHYWSTKNMLFVGGTVKDRPALVAAASHAYDNWQEQWDDKPASLRQKIHAFRMPDWVPGGLGGVEVWIRPNSLTNPALFAVPNAIADTKRAWDRMDGMGTSERIMGTMSEGMKQLWNAMGYRLGPHVDWTIRALLDEDLATGGKGMDVARWVDQNLGLKWNVVEGTANMFQYAANPSDYYSNPWVGLGGLETMAQAWEPAARAMEYMSLKVNGTRFSQAEFNAVTIALVEMKNEGYWGEGAEAEKAYINALLDLHEDNITEEVREAIGRSKRQRASTAFFSWLGLPATYYTESWQRSFELNAEFQRRMLESDVPQFRGQGEIPDDLKAKQSEWRERKLDLEAEREKNINSGMPRWEAEGIYQKGIAKIWAEAADSGGMFTTKGSEAEVWKWVREEAPELLGYWLSNKGPDALQDALKRIENQDSFTEAWQGLQAYWTDRNTVTATFRPYFDQLNALDLAYDEAVRKANGNPFLIDQAREILQREKAAVWDRMEEEGLEWIGTGALPQHGSTYYQYHYGPFEMKNERAVIKLSPETGERELDIKRSYYPGQVTSGTVFEGRDDLNVNNFPNGEGLSRWAERQVEDALGAIDRQERQAAQKGFIFDIVLDTLDLKMRGPDGSYNEQFVTFTDDGRAIFDHEAYKDAIADSWPDIQKLYDATLASFYDYSPGAGLMEGEVGMKGRISTLKPYLVDAGAAPTLEEFTLHARGRSQLLDEYWTMVDEAAALYFDMAWDEVITLDDQRFTKNGLKDYIVATYGEEALDLFGGDLTRNELDGVFRRVLGPKYRDRQIKPRATEEVTRVLEVGMDADGSVFFTEHEQTIPAMTAEENYRYKSGISALYRWVAEDLTSGDKYRLRQKYPHAFVYIEPETGERGRWQMDLSRLTPDEVYEIRQTYGIPLHGNANPRQADPPEMPAARKAQQQHRREVEVATNYWFDKGFLSEDQLKRNEQYQDFVKKHSDLHTEMNFFRDEHGTDGKRLSLAAAEKLAREQGNDELADYIRAYRVTVRDLDMSEIWDAERLWLNSGDPMAEKLLGDEYMQNDFSDDPTFKRMTEEERESITRNQEFRQQLERLSPEQIQNYYAYQDWMESNSEALDRFNQIRNEGGYTIAEAVAKARAEGDEIAALAGEEMVRQREALGMYDIWDIMYDDESDTFTTEENTYAAFDPQGLPATDGIGFTASGPSDTLATPPAGSSSSGSGSGSGSSSGDAGGSSGGSSGGYTYGYTPPPARTGKTAPPDPSTGEPPVHPSGLRPGTLIAAADIPDISSPEEKREAMRYLLQYDPELRTSKQHSEWFERRAYVVVAAAVIANLLSALDSNDTSEKQMLMRQISRRLGQNPDLRKWRELLRWLGIDPDTIAIPGGGGTRRKPVMSFGY